MSKRRLTDYISVDVMVEKEAYGGMGHVYMGPDHTFHEGRWRALKTLHPSLLATERGKRLFLNECLTWVGLWPHPNLLSAQSVTEIDNQLYLVLDYAEHGNLRDQFRRFEGSQGGRPLPLHGALAIAENIAAGLVALHTPDPNFLRFRPIVHRDLKPENILFKQIDQNHFVQISDLGLAKVLAELGTDEEDTAVDGGDVSAGEVKSAATFLSGKAAHAIPASASFPAAQSLRYRTERGVAMGTCAYMPPEQWVDAVSAGPPADLYAFGIILGELLLGTHPLLPWESGGYRASKEQWRRTHFETSPPPLATARTRAWHAARALMPDPPLLPEILKLFRGLLAKRAEDRPTAAETLAVLQRAITFSGEQSYLAPEITPHTAEQECGVWHNWAISYFRFGQNDDALDRNDRALALASAHSSVLLNHHVLTMRGNILGAMGRIDEALACYDRALASLPVSDANHRSVVLCMRGMYLKDAGYHERAEEAFVEALQLNPESPVIWHDRAYNERVWGDAFAKNGQREEAERHWRLGLAYVAKALLHNPDNPKITMLRDSLRQALRER